MRPDVSSSGSLGLAKLGRDVVLAGQIDLETYLLYPSLGPEQYLEGTGGSA